MAPALAILPVVHDEFSTANVFAPQVPMNSSASQVPSESDGPSGPPSGGLLSRNTGASRAEQVGGGAVSIVSLRSFPFGEVHAAVEAGRARVGRDAQRAEDDRAPISPVMKRFIDPSCPVRVACWSPFSML